MSGIFISYRREDAKAYARLVSDALAAHFGPENIFRDIDTLGPGVDFPEAIADAVSSCDVLLALIGEKWLTVAQQGKRRLDNPRDYVRLEIAAALQRDILVIPLLIEDTAMPEREELPPDLAELADRNAHRVSDAGWADSMRRLIAALDKVVTKRAPANGERALSPPGPTPSGPPPWSQPASQPAQPSPSPWSSQPTPWSSQASPGSSSTQTPPSPWAPRTAGGGTAPGGPSISAGGGGGGGGGKTIAIAAAAGVAVVVVVALLFVLGGGGNGDDGADGGGTDRSVVVGPDDTGGSSETSTPQVNFDPFTPAKVTVSPTSGRPGSTVTVSGTGFAPNEDVDIRLHVDVVAETRTDARGEFSGVSFSVPDTPFRQQQYSVIALGATSHKSDSAPFTVN
jgi:hypothetical protein